MAIHPSFHDLDEFIVDVEDSLECPVCHTSADLIIESLQPHQPRRPGMVEVEYSCGRCDSYSAHTASVQAVAKVLQNTPAVCDSSGVLKFGEHYIHCGEPMEDTNPLAAPMPRPSNDPHAEPHGAPLASMLRCQCGFHIQIDHPSPKEL